MFNLQGSELIIILLLALVVLGPEKLPDAMRKMGQFYAEVKKMSSGFQQEFRSVVDEPMREMRDTANMLRDSADFTKLQDGEREEKPKSAEMVTDPGLDVEDAPTDPMAPSEDAPFSYPRARLSGVDTETADAADADAADPAPRRPFSGDQLSSAAPRPAPLPAADADEPVRSDGGEDEEPVPVETGTDPDAEVREGDHPEDQHR